jgi:hypothetical protein
LLDTIEYFIETRGNTCENCGALFDKYLNPPTRHHCLIKVSKKHPEYDHEINIELAGWTCCHETGKLDTQEHKVEFAMRQINRGYNVKAWVESLNLKAPEQWLLNL